MSVSSRIGRSVTAFLFALLLVTSGAVLAQPAGQTLPVPAAAARVPLLMQGKKTLFQRVLTRPGAMMVKAPGEAGGTAVPALSQFYVYQRRAHAGEEWVEVGSGSRGKVDGWIAGSAVLPWEQQLALAFTNPAGRERALLFNEKDTVLQLLKAKDPGAAVAPIRTAVAAGKSDPRVVSIEPETYIDIDKQFYLLPILQAAEIDTGTGFRARVLEIASVTAKKGGASPADTGKASAQPPQPAALRSFSAAIVFVIDSTISMGPYIDRTRDAVRRIYDAVEKAGLAKQVRFGLIAFRSSVKAVPQLEYAAKMYADPSEVRDGKDFLARVAALKPATVSSPHFDEDPYAGVMAAVRGIKWGNFGGRYLVLITDAGAIGGDDPLSSTGLGASEVRLELQRLGIALYALHLKTPQGKANHPSAQAQYEDLSRNPITNSALYYPVEAGSVDQFGRIVDRLSGAIVDSTRAAAKGELVAGSARGALTSGTDAKADPVLAKLDAETELLGRAMQLAYLGRVQGTTAPPLFRAWLSDRDYAKLERPTTEVRVLLTKSQLSDLAQVVGTILDAGEKSQATSTADFFDLIRSAAAQIARDPAALNNPSATKLGELGLLSEYLDGLPYKSDVMALTRDIWASWSISEQEELLDKLRRKLRLYQLYHDDVDRWVSLAPNADAGERVYPVPLEALP